MYLLSVCFNKSNNLQLFFIEIILHSASLYHCDSDFIHFLKAFTFTVFKSKSCILQIVSIHMQITTVCVKYTQMKDEIEESTVWFYLIINVLREVDSVFQDGILLIQMGLKITLIE